MGSLSIYNNAYTIARNVHSCRPESRDNDQRRDHNGHSLGNDNGDHDPRTVDSPVLLLLLLHRHAAAEPDQHAGGLGVDTVARQEEAQEEPSQNRLSTTPDACRNILDSLKVVEVCLQYENVPLLCSEDHSWQLKIWQSLFKI